MAQESLYGMRSATTLSTLLFTHLRMIGATKLKVFCLQIKCHIDAMKIKTKLPI